MHDAMLHGSQSTGPRERAGRRRVSWRPISKLTRDESSKLNVRNISPPTYKSHSETDAIPFLSAGGNPHSEPSGWRGLPQDRMHRAVWLAADHLEGRSQQFPFVSFRLGRCNLSISVPIIQIAGRNVNAGQSLSWTRQIQSIFR